MITTGLLKIHEYIENLKATCLIRPEMAQKKLLRTEICIQADLKPFLFHHLLARQEI